MSRECLGKRSLLPLFSHTFFFLATGTKQTILKTNVSVIGCLLFYGRFPSDCSVDQAYRSPPGLDGIVRSGCQTIHSVTKPIA